MENTKKRLVMWNKTEVKPIGSARVIVQNAKNFKKYSLEFIIVRENLQPLIGAKTAQQMKLISVDTESVNVMMETGKCCESLVNEFADLFNDDKLGRLPGIVKLRVKPEINPSVMPARNVPVAMKSKFHDELQRLLNLGVIEMVDEPSEWVSAFVTPIKRSGELRICIDPKSLNTALLREHYKLPTFDDVLPELSKAKVFSTLD